MLESRSQTHPTATRCLTRAATERAGALAELERGRDRSVRATPGTCESVTVHACPCQVIRKLCLLLSVTVDQPRAWALCGGLLQGAGVDPLLRVFDALRTVHEGRPIDSFNDDSTYKNGVIEVRTLRKQEGRAGKSIRRDCGWRVRRAAGARPQEGPCHEAGRAPSAVVRTRTLPHLRAPTPLPPPLGLLTQEPCKHTIP